MEYRIDRVGRTVSLNDEIVEEYCKYVELHDSIFMLAMRMKYEKVPTEEEVSKKELSEFCNEVLLDELEVMAMLPKAIQAVMDHWEEWQEASRTGKCISIKLDD